MRASLLLLAALAVPSRAEVPMPVFPDCAEDALSSCPQDLREDDWDQVSWIPQNAKASVFPAELDIGSGVGVDRAIRYEAGRFDVPIAFLDSGVEWGEQDILRKFLLNTGELPLPQLTDGTTATDYDVDGSGVVNIDDWAEDGRVTAASGDDPFDDVLDPSDLIAVFSDGTDGDGNGYTDDICGWDFFEFDNDAWSDSSGSLADHGTGVMSEAAQEGNDGRGGIGVCPNCSVLPLRMGDAIIDDGERVGMGLAYAVDRGARAASMPLGALTHSALTVAAIDYAEANGMVLIGAAGDENSYHHNFPAVGGHILYVHSIRGNNSQEDGPDVTSFLSFFDCNNYGPRLDLVAPSNGCATGATAKTAGAAGLVTSAALNAGIDLEPATIRAILRGNADDINLSAADLAEVKTYPSKPGWDAFYGAGRLNIGRSIESMVRDGEIPPLVSIDSPQWFSFSPNSGSIAVTGRVHDATSWKVETGWGAEPTEWTEVASGTAAVDGALATIDVSDRQPIAYGDLADETPSQRMTRAHQPLLMVQVTATNADGVSAVDRRGFWVQPDPDNLPGFPYDLGGSGESTPQLADLDGDGDFEIVVANGSGVIHALNADGSDLAGWPVHTDPIPFLATVAAAHAYASGAVPGDQSEGVIGPPAIGDIDGDGEVDVVIAGVRGAVYAWHADGTAVGGFPVHIVGHTAAEIGGRFGWDNGVYAAPVLADVDGDDALELVVGGLDQRLYVWHGDGTLLPGYPLLLCDDCEQGARIVSSPSVGDLDGDGALDVILGTNEVPRGAAGLVFAVDLASATVKPGFPIERGGLINQSVLPVIGEGHPGSTALTPSAGGGLAIASDAMLGSDGLIDGDGADVLDVSWVRDGFGAGGNLFHENALVSMITNPAIGDLDGDGVKDLVIGGTGPQFLLSLIGTQEVHFEHGVLAWNGADATTFPGFPRQVDDVSFLVTPSIADVSGDGVPEVIYGSGGYFVYAWDKDGNLADGWPKFAGGWLLGGISVGDIDGDGFLDAVTTTREGWLFAWKTNGRADQAVQWGTMRHDNRNTGNTETPIAAQAGPPDDETGCCHKKRDGRDSIVLLALFPLVAWRRRRR